MTYIFETGHSQPLSCKESGDGLSISHLETNHSESFQINLMKIKDQVKLAIKPDPSSRKICLLGNKSQREVLTLGFISEKLILLKMLIKPEKHHVYGIKYERDETSYWTLMNGITCEIIKMP